MRIVMSGFVNYKYKDGVKPGHTKRAFEKHNVVTGYKDTRIQGYKDTSIQK